MTAHEMSITSGGRRAALVQLLIGCGLMLAPGCAHQSASPDLASAADVAEAPGLPAAAPAPPVCGVNISAADAISGVTGVSFCRSSVLAPEMITAAALAYLREAAVAAGRTKQIVLATERPEISRDIDKEPGQDKSAVFVTVTVSGWFLTDAEAAQLDLNTLDAGDRLVNLGPLPGPAKLPAGESPPSQATQAAKIK